MIITLTSLALTVNVTDRAPVPLDVPRVQENVIPAPKLKVLPPPVKQRAAGETSTNVDNGPHVKWHELKIEGATAISNERLRSEWRHKAGTDISLADVKAFADAITRVYAESGYMLSFALVSPDAIQNGVVTVRIVEGFVNNVAWTGAPPPPIAKAMARQLLTSRPLKMAHLERYLLMMNDIPGLSVQGTLSPAAGVVGGSLLTIDVKRNAFEVDAGINNFMPSSLGRFVVGSNVAFNVFDGAAVRLGGWHSIDSDAYASVSGSYDAGLGADGFRVVVGGSWSRMRPVNETLQAIEYEGKAVTGNVGLRHQLIRARSNNLYLETGFSLNDARANYVAGSLMLDKLRNAEVALGWENSEAPGAASSIRVEFSKGLPILGARGDSRANGTTDYATVNVGVLRQQPLASLKNGKLLMLASIYGQLSLRGPLYSAAECGYGGRQFGRRYDAGVLSGERCLLGSAEIQYSGAFWDVNSGANGQLYGFIDGGIIRQQGILIPGELRGIDASSIGAGVRVNLRNRLSGGFEVSGPLTRPAQWSENGSVKASIYISMKF